MVVPQINPVNPAGIRNYNFAAGEKYSKRVVSEAVRLLKINEPVFSENYRKTFGKCMSEVKFQPIAWITAKTINFVNRNNPEIENVSISELRGYLAICSLGISEFLKLPEGLIRKLVNELTYNSYSKKVDKCLSEFKKTA